MRKRTIEVQDSDYQGVVSDLMRNINNCHTQCESQNHDSWEQFTQDLSLNVGNFAILAEVNPNKGISFDDVASILNVYAQRATALCKKRIKVKC